MKSKLFILLLAVCILAVCGLLTGCSKKKTPAVNKLEQAAVTEGNIPSSADPKLQRAVEKTTEAQSEERRSREEQ